MKKLFLLLALVGMVATACEDDGVNEPTNPPTETPDGGNDEKPDDGNDEKPDDGNNEKPDDGNDEKPDDGNDEKPDDNTPEDKTQPIKFIDNTVKTLCVISWDTNGDAELSYEEAAAVTDIGTTFKSSAIISFTELAYFTGLSYIADEAFLDCGSLKKIELPHNITSIGAKAFSGCTGELIINSKIIETDYSSDNNPTNSSSGWLFESKFTKLTIGDNITEIGDYAFCECTSLTSVTIPDSVIEIGGSAFAGCTGELIINSKIIETNYSYDNYPAYSSSGWLYESRFTKLTIGDSITKIGRWTFEKCRSLTSVTIPDSVTSIGWSAFQDCTSLTSVTIPDSVTWIGQWAFGYCYSLTSVTIPDSVTSIEGSAFNSCTSLTSVTIPDSVTWIGGGAFAGCTSLTNFYGKFASEDNRCLIVDGQLIAFAPGGLTEYTIPDSVTSIGHSAFRDCTSLTSVTIPDSVTSIGYEAFDSCNSLTSVTIPDSVTEIGGYAFSYCTSLTSVTIPDSVTSIGYSAFEGCNKLTSVTIPDSVTTIGERAFKNCSSLTSVYCKAATPPAGEYDMFKSNASGRKIYVPTASVEAYKSAEYWSDYASDIVGYEF